MPRISTRSYLNLRVALATSRVWLHTLEPDDVLALNRFFAPTKSFTDAEAIAHRRTVTAADSSLPHRAGKILKKTKLPVSALERKVARSVGVSEPGPTVFGRPGKEQILLVKPFRLESPDLRRLANIFIQDMRKPVGERLIDRIPRRDQDDAA